MPRTVADAVLAASDGCRRQVNTPLPPLLFWPGAERFVLLDVIGGRYRGHRRMCHRRSASALIAVLTFRHDLVRQAVLSGSATRTDAANAQVLDALRAHRIDQDMLARLAELARTPTIGPPSSSSRQRPDCEQRTWDRTAKRRPNTTARSDSPPARSSAPSCCSGSRKSVT
jgi:hypothetical protein